MKPMKADGRRRAILEKLAAATGPVSASRLAEQLGVTRQIVVGDVALLRAAGAKIEARAALLAELESVNRKDIIYLKEHYVFRPMPDGTYEPVSSI